MIDFEELDEIDVKNGVLEVTVKRGKPDEFIEGIKREILEKRGYEVTQIIKEGNVYYIHFK